MAMIKCKMCGGDLVLAEDQTVAECEYCGSIQTVPIADDEKKLIQFARAERLRKQCEFDKAAGIYESIVADFREEAEAYWGLVLCKFGIEYVDDPGTGKKIPTCHRSSFESIMEDSDYEQALENADAVARKVYREEAKQIEELRKGIIAVSANEEPYDIFICYKETDENGERTLDSVLAQDIYDLLTDKGYRTFFARITLEDKLGLEYEPYIFAALNSAKIMLAVGTDYEFFNAVWVKNEWSRYLKLMANDKEKHLIPCYKGIDAYDMPREFARLQAQDLGKVGAMQDLLRGIEKLLPKNEPTNTVVIQQPLTNTGIAMLKRGNMALEDGDWASADKFFEEVLNQDAECAEAYLGKALVQQKARSLEELTRKRLVSMASPAKKETFVKVKNVEMEREIASRWELPNYLEFATIREMFKFNNRYYSTTESRKQQLQAEKNWFAQDRNLSRALRYANGPFKQKLEQAQKQVLDQLEKYIQTAEKADQDAVKRIQEEYQNLLKQVDGEAKNLREAAEQKREEDYQNYMAMAEIAIERNIRNLLTEAQEKLIALQDYKDSAQMVQNLQEKIDAINAAIAEKRRKAEEEKRYAQEVREAYGREVPMALERPQVEQELNHLETQIKELAADLKNRGFLLFSVVFFILGMVEFIFGLDGDETLLIVGGLCGFGFGIATIAQLIHRAKLRRQLRECQGKVAPLQKKLEDINGCMSFGEFARTYKLRQTEEGRAQLEEEENQRKLREERARVEAKRAKRKKLIKRLVITTVILLLIAGVALAGWYYMFHYLPGQQVKAVEDLIAAGNYQAAYDALHNLDYGNSQELKDQIALKGKYAVTGVVVDYDSYKADDYHYWITYNEHGLPSAFYSAEENGQTQLPADLKPLHKFEYTFYESGNLKTCAVYTNRFPDGEAVAVPEGEIWHVNVADPYCLDTEITFFNTPEATVVYQQGSGHAMGDRWSSIDTIPGIRCWDAQRIQHFILETGEVAETTNYQENGLPVGTEWEEDDQGRIVRYYWTDSELECRMTYNEDGTTDSEKFGFVPDDQEPTYLSTYFYDYHYENGNLTDWAVYPTSDKKDADQKEFYTYDEFGKLLTVTLYQKDGYGLDKIGEYTFTYTWLDYDAIAAEAEQQRQEELRQQEEERRKAQEELDRKKNAYAAAEDLEAQGRTAEAAVAFGKLAGFMDAEERCRALWSQQGVQTFAAARAHIVMLKNDGSVDATGAKDDGRCDVSDWTGVVSVAGINGQTFGLRLDGTVLATGYNENGQCDVGDWEDIVAISASPFHTVGLRSDGTVVATGYNEFGQCEVWDWTDIVAISANEYHTVGLRSDGTVVAAGYADNGMCDVSEWTDITAICTSSSNTYGLRSDGTVVAVGENNLWQCEVGYWTDIVAISADTGYVVGLRSDGTVVAEGNNDYDQCSVYYWTDIVAVATRNSHVVGLRSDGTVIARGYNGNGQCEIDTWTDVVAISVSEFETVGLTADGRILVASRYTEDYNFEKFNDVSISENLIPVEAVVEEESDG